MKPPERSTRPSSPHVRTQDDVPGTAQVPALPARRGRRFTRAELLVALPLLGLTGLTVLTVPVFALSAALTGTPLPLVSPAGQAAPAGDRAVAAVVGLVSLGLLAGAARAVVLRCRAPHTLLIDSDGVWLGRAGRRPGRPPRADGLPWSRIAAVDVVPADPPRIPEQQGGPRGGRTCKVAPVVRAGLARKPFVDLYPVDRVQEDPATPLGRRVVTAQPSAPGLRGRRYVVELAGTHEEIAALSRALAVQAPHKRLTSG